MDRLGNETAVAFTLGFDFTKLANPEVSLGSDSADGMVLTTNATRSEQGQLAVLVDSDKPFVTGQIVTITFDVRKGSAGSDTDVMFTNEITLASTSDPEGNLLPTRFIGGTVNLSVPETTERVLFAGEVGLRSVSVPLKYESTLRTATSPVRRYRFDNIFKDRSSVLPVESKRYRFEPLALLAEADALEDHSMIFDGS
jgi:hypothetical protein